MATTNINVKLVDETRAGFNRINSQLQGLQGSVGGLTRGFGGLGAAIAGAFSVRELVNVASSFQDLRSSLGLLYKDIEVGNQRFEEIKQFATSSIFSVEQLTESFIKLKGAGIEPTTELLNLFQDTAAISADSVGALQAITDLFARTTAGGLGLEELNRLADRGIPVFDILQKKLGITRLEVSKIGQTAQGAQDILQALQQGLSEQFGGAVSARVNNVSQAMSNFGDAIDNALDAIGQAGFNQALTEATQTMTQFIDKNQELIKSIGQGLGNAITFVVDNIKALTAAFIGYFAVVTVGKIVAIAKAFNSLNLVMGKNVLLKLVGGAIAAAGAFGLMNTETEDLNSEIEKNTEVTKENNKQNQQVAITSSVVAENRAKEAQALKNLSETLSNTFSQMREELTLQGERIRLSDEQIRIQEELIDIKQKTNDTLIKLEKDYASKTADERERLKETYDSEKQAIIELGQQQEEQATRAIQFAIEQERARRLELFSIDAQIKLQNDLMAVQDSMAKMTMTTIERKYYDIERAAIQSAKAQIEQEERLRNAKLTPEEVQEYYDAALKGSELLKKSVEEEFNQSRRWSTGWKRAFNDYVEDATDAARQAERVFTTATRGMEDAIVGFAKTGKFEFRDLVSTILEEMLRIQIRQAIGGIFGGGSSGGGLFGGIGKLLGFANGGIIPTNAPVLVGERGPELLTGAAGNRVIPNNQLGTNITYNINAVDAASFKQLVARDPAFIYAVTQQGAKTIPVGRR